MLKFSTQIASNVDEDSLSLEILDEAGVCVAVVARIDSGNTLKFILYSDSMDVGCVQEILRIAETELVAFEDGTPLNEAKRVHCISS